LALLAYNGRTLKDTFYITTPIYYPNDVPHIGHAYTTVACDVIARYHRLRGEKVLFLTGTDEHGQKIARAAEERGLTPDAWLDEVIPQWKEAWERLAISYDDFIRTTEERHVGPVATFVQRLWESGDLYLGTYEGLYCVPCEEFKVESEIVDGNCSVHGRPVEMVSEENYFFRLSAYKDRLVRLYEENPSFVRPEARRNEVLSFVKGGLRDFSVSRTSFTWGVPLLWDRKHVTYVWVDALLNYITAAGFGADEGRFGSIWPADVHMMSKDILRFHAVYWPAMLMAAGVPVPSGVFVHGYLLVGGVKMSKTKLTGIHPFQLTDHFGVDAYRYHFLREVPFGQDGSFSWESMTARYNADLANGLGNLASRVLAMAGFYFDAAVPEPSSREPRGRLGGQAADLAERFDLAVLALDLTVAVAALDGFVREANRYLVEVSPWHLAKDPERRQDLADCLYESLEALRVWAVLAYPVMPGAAAKLWEQLGIEEALDSQRVPGAAAWGLLEPGTKTNKGEPIFPRLEG
jgi:methionyl-tRNA synthetase